MKCWLGFHDGDVIDQHPKKKPYVPGQRYSPWYTYTLKCKRCNYVWKEAPKPFD